MVLSLYRETDFFNFVTGTLLGDILALYLFKFWLDYVIRTSIDLIKEKGFALNSEFSFILIGCHTKIKKHSMPYYFLIAGGRMISFILFLTPLMLHEMQTG